MKEIKDERECIDESRNGGGGHGKGNYSGNKSRRWIYAVTIVAIIIIAAIVVINT